MRHFLFRFMAVSLTAGQVLAAPLAQAECARPMDKSAFDVAGMKSELMVVALTCDVRDKYNDFVARYQPTLRAQEHNLDSYFHRAYGRRAQKAHDDYITLLANVQSETGIKQGTLFCRENIGLFDEVLALPKSADIVSYAGSKAFVQPATLTTCTDTRGPAERGPRRARVRKVSMKTHHN